MNSLIPLSAIEAARGRLRPYIGHTPLRYSAALSARFGAQVWLKPENWQPTGSFKVRGALNKLSLLEPRQKARGLVTASAGNHALGVAYAAQALGGVETDIFVPENAPLSKLARLRHFDVRLHVQGESYDAAHQAAAAHATATGATEMPAYDDPDVIAGQGTIGLEILADLPEVDVILVPVGGGGLIAGIATAARALRPATRVIGVQPAASPAALLSLRDGRYYDPYDHEPTLADGLAGGFGRWPFELAGPLIDRILLASERDLRRAIFTLLDLEQMVVEASGAIAVTPFWRNEIDLSGQRVVCVLTGGNLDTAVLHSILAEFAD